MPETGETPEPQSVRIKPFYSAQRFSVYRACSDAGDAEDPGCLLPHR